MGYGCRVLPDAPRAARPAAAASPARPRPVRPARLVTGGPIEVDTVWDADTVRVVADVEVRAGASLAITAGTRVVFAGHRGLTVADGDLQAIGAPGAPVTFTAAEPALYAEDQDTLGCWRGITLANVPAARDSTRLSWCVLEYAKAVVPGPPARDVAGGVVPAGAGGALRIVNTDKVRVDHCRLRHNCADRGGAVLVHYAAAPLLANNLLHDNRAFERAGAVFVSYGAPRLVHTTMAGNRTTNASAHVATGAIDNYQSRTVCVGDVVFGNATAHHAGTQVLEPRAFGCRFNLIGGFAGGEGNLDLDPLFLLEGAEPYALAPGSPCRDAGLAAAAPWLDGLDLAGAPRIAGVAPDLGAFELTGVVAVAGGAPAAVGLLAWPNPANPRTELRIGVARTGPVRLEVVDLRGRRVRRLLAATLAAGVHVVAWDGRDDAGRATATGTYLVRLVTTDGCAARSISIVR